MAGVDVCCFLLTKTLHLIRSFTHTLLLLCDLTTHMCSWRPLTHGVGTKPPDLIVSTLPFTFWIYVIASGIHVLRHLNVHDTSFTIQKSQRKRFSYDVLVVVK